MSQLTEDRLRAAFAARADLVQPNQLKPAEVPTPARHGDRRWVAPLSMAAAVAAVTVGAVVASQLGDPSAPVPAVPPAPSTPSTVQTTPPTTPPTPAPSTSTAEPAPATETVSVLGLSFSLPVAWSTRETDGATACLSATRLSAKACLEQRTGPALTEGVVTVVRRRAGEDRLDPAAPFGGAAECAATVGSGTTVRLTTTTARYGRFTCEGEPTVQQWVLKGEQVVVWHVLPKEKAVAETAVRSVKVVKDLPAPAVTETGVKVNGRIPLSDLPRGKDTTLPFLVGGVLHDGDLQIRVADPDGIHRITRVDGGYVAERQLSDTTPGRSVVLIRADGSLRTLVPVADVVHYSLSPDRGQLAWSQTSTDGDDVHKATLGVMRVGSWTSLRTRTVPFKASVADWTTAGVMVRNGSDNGSGDTVARMWDTATDTLTKLPPGFSPRHANVAAGTMSIHDDRVDPFSKAFCMSVVRDDDPGTELWRSCDYHVGEDFSPDGRTALLWAANADGEGPLRYEIADAATGRITGHLAGDFETNLVWEDATHFVFSLAEGTQEALVRCSTAGYCERASDFETVSGNTYEDPAYDIGRR